MRNRIRVIAAAAAAAALTASGTTAALASTSGKPGAPAKTVSVSTRCAPGTDLAARLGVSQDRLDQALRKVKSSLSTYGAKPTEERFEAALARALGISRARVRHVLDAQKPCSKPVGHKPGPYQPAPKSGSEALASAVAKELRVTTARVNAALAAIFAAGQADPSSPAFAAAARALGVSPQQLSTALMEAKQSLAGSS